MKDYEIKELEVLLIKEYDKSFKKCQELEKDISLFDKKIKNERRELLGYMRGINFSLQQLRKYNNTKK